MRKEHLTCDILDLGPLQTGLSAVRSTWNRQHHIILSIFSGLSSNKLTRIHQGTMEGLTDQLNYL